MQLRGHPLGVRGRAGLMIKCVYGVGPVRSEGIMKLYLAVPVVLVALLIAASGVAALTRGWVLASNRSPVRRPRLSGWGQLAVAFALCRQKLFLLALDGTGPRQWGPDRQRASDERSGPDDGESAQGW